MSLGSRLNKVERAFNIESQGDGMGMMIIIPMGMDEPPTPGQFISCPHRDCLDHCGDKKKCDLPDSNYKVNGKILYVKLPKKLPKGWMKNEKP